jgi:LPXTG-motif cell wall-anchored protein
VPSACRRIVVLLVVACLGVGGSVVPALAQNAGDQQYQDPFGDSGSGSDSSDSSSSGSGADTQLSPSPQTSGGSTKSTTSSGGGSTAATTTTPSVAQSGTLPNTGLDTRVLLLAGVGLLLAGVGLRMRNAPERF